MGHMDMNRDMGWRLPRTNVDHRSLQLFLHALLAGHFAMFCFPAVVPSFKGIWVYLSQEIVGGDPKPADPSNSFLLSLLFLFGPRHSSTPSIKNFAESTNSRGSARLRVFFHETLSLVTNLKQAV